MAERIRIVIDAEGDAAVREATKVKAALAGIRGEMGAHTRAGAAFNAMTRQQAASLRGLRQDAIRVGTVLGGGLAAGLIHVAKTGAAFETQMARVKAVTGATGAEMEKLNKVAIKLGADTKFSAGEAAAAMYELSSAGFSVKETTAALPGTLSLAAASSIELKDAAEISANALRGFGLEADQSTHVADVLSQAVNSSSVEMTDLQLSLKYIGPIAKATGQSFETMIAAVAQMGDAGIKGEQAGTALRGGLVRLVKPTKQVGQGLKELGLHSSDLTDPKKGLVPLPELIGKLQKGMRGLGQDEKAHALASIFGTEALTGMLTLVDSGPARLNKLTREFEKSDGASKKAATTMNDTVSGAFDQLKGSIETVEIQLFQHFQKPLREALMDATKLVNTEGKHVQEFFDDVFATDKFKEGNLGQKIEAIFDEIKRRGLGEKLGDTLTDGVNAALPKIAEALGKGGVLAAKTFAKAFMDSSPLGRLALAGWLLHKVGLLAAFRAAGVQGGAAMGSGMATGVAKGGAFKATMIGLAKQGAIAAAIAAGIAFGPELIKQMRGKQGVEVSSDSVKKFTADLRTSFSTASRSTNKFGQDIDGLKRTLHGLAGADGPFRDLGRKFAAAADDVEGGVHDVDVAIGRLRTRSAANLGTLMSNVRLNMRLISTAFKKDSAEGTRAFMANVRAAAAAIKRSMRDGQVATGAGLAQIDKLFSEALAQYGITNKDAGRNLRRGLDPISGKPVGTGRGTAKGGFVGAATGAMMLGRKGERGYDNVPLVLNGEPIMAARGELAAVFNRHQQKVVDGALQAQGVQGGLSEVFAKVKTPHYMAAGGSVGTIPKVNVRSDLGNVSRISQAGVDMTRDAANKKLAAMAPVAGPGGGGGGGGAVSTTGLVPQVVRALAWARAHGWGGVVTSGFRSDAEQVRIWNSGIRPAAKPRSLGGPGSNHSLGQAVDVSDPGGFGRAMQSAPPNSRLYNNVPNDPIHFSVTGHAHGGFVEAARQAWVGATAGYTPPGLHKPTPKHKTSHKTPKHKHGKKFKRRDLPGLPRNRIEALAKLINVDIAGAEEIYDAMASDADATTEEFFSSDKDGKQTVNTAGVSTRKGELGGLIAQLTGVESSEVTAAGGTGSLTKVLAAGIAARTAEIKRMRDAAKKNIDRIKALRKRRNKAKAGSKERKQLNDQISTLMKENRRLTGEDDKVGTGGLVGQVASGRTAWSGYKTDVDDWRSDLIGIKGDPGNLAGIRTGRLGDTRRGLEALRRELADLDPSALSKQLSDDSGSGGGGEGGGGDSGGAGDNGMADLLRQQLDELRNQLGIQRAQLQVFSGFVPLVQARYAGSFQQGGRVPIDGWARLHRDEVVLEDPNGPAANSLTAQHQQQRPMSIEFHADSDLAPLIRRLTTVIDGRVTDLVSSQIGRRTRLIAAAPGGHR